VKNGSTDDEGRTSAPDLDLRLQAEARLDGLSAAAPVPEELSALVHELRVHQIELEMQNEELQRGRLELEEQHARYFELFDLAPVGYLTLSDKGIVEVANLRAGQLLGVDRLLLVGQPFSAFVPASDQGAYYLHLREQAQSEVPQTCELRLQRLGAEPFWAHLEGRPQIVAHGEPLRHHLTFTDVHDRVVAEEALRRSERALQSTVDGLDANIAVLDESGMIVLVNQLWRDFAEHNGLSAGAVYEGTDYLRVCDAAVGESSQEAAPLAAGIRAVLSAETDSYIIEYPCDAPDEKRWFAARVTALPGEGPRRAVVAHVDITARKQAEEALRDRETIFRSIVEQAGDSIGLVDVATGRFVEFNDAACRNLGYTRDEFAAMGLADVDLQWPGEGIVQALADLQASGLNEFETRHRCKDGEVRDVRVSATMIDVAGRALFAGIWQDITERKRAEQALAGHRQRLEQLVVERTEELGEANRVLADGAAEVARSHQNFDTFFNTIDDLLFVLDGDGIMINVNETVCRRLGYTEDELLGRPVLDVHPPARREEAGAIVAAMLAGEAAFCPVPVVTKGGAEIPVETRVVPGVWNGEPALFGVTKDVSALRLSEEKFDRLFRSNPASMAVSSLPEQHLIDVNDAFLDTLGYTRDEVIGRTSLELELFVEPEEQHDVADQLREQGRVADRELRIRRRDGTILDGVFSGEIIESGGQQYLLTVMIDLTERKQAEEALRESEEKFRLVADFTYDWETWRNPDGTYRYVSPSCERITGHTAAEFLADPDLPLKITHPDDQAKVRSHHDSLAHKAQDRPLDLEFRIVTPGGETRWINQWSAAVYGEDGQWLGRRVSNRDVTANKQAADRVRQSEEQLARAVEGSGVGLWDWQVQTGEETFSERWAEIAGYTLAELAPTSIETWRRLTHPDDLQRADQLLEEHFRGESAIYACEARVRHKDGHWVWVLDQGKVSEWDGDGRPRRMTGTELDITERKQAEESLRDSEELYRSILSASPENITITDAQGLVRLTSPTAPAMYGYQRVEEGLGRSIYDFLAPEDRDRAKANAALMSAGALSGPRAYLGLRADGSTFPNEVSSELIRDARGQPAGMVVIARDITERMQAEEALRQTTERLSLAARAGGVGVWDYDPVNDALTWDEQMFALYGIRREQFSGAYEAWQAGLHPDDKQRGDEEIQAALRGEKEFDTEFRVRWPDGTVRDIRALALVQRDASGRPTHMIGTNWDITEIKHTEERLRDANHRLEEAGVLARDLAAQAQAATNAKSRFLANMSHEIRTPLNAIIGFAQLLQHDPQLSAQQGDRVAIINRSGEHLLALLTDILELSKVEAGRQDLDPTTFDLRELLEDLALVFRVRAEAKKLVFGTDGLDRVPRYVTTDQLKLRQILTNLLSNAVKFADTGGVRLRTSASQGEAGESRLVVLVEDDGPGIAAAEMEALFAPFEQATAGHQRGSGTGLGLTISREFAHIMGGDLTVTSEVGRGSVFRLEIPIEAGTAESAAARVAARRVMRIDADQPRFGVLVVDDQDGRTLLVDMLGEAGFDAFAAGDAGEALAAFASRRPQVVIMAHGIADVDSTAATRRIRSCPGGDTAKIIALTASATGEVRNSALAAGADAFMAKPFRAAELFEQIRLLSGVRYVYAAAAPPEAAADDEPPGLTREMMDALPAELREQIGAAAVRARHDRLLKLTEQVAAIDPGVGEELRKSIASFDYAAVLRALEQDPS